MRQITKGKGNEQINNTHLFHELNLHENLDRRAQKAGGQGKERSL